MDPRYIVFSEDQSQDSVSSISTTASTSSKKKEVQTENIIFHQSMKFSLKLRRLFYLKKHGLQLLQKE